MKGSLSTPNRGGRIEVEEQKETEDEIREKWDGKERGGGREKVGRILWVEKAGGNILYIYFELSLWRVSVCMWAVCVVVLVWQCRRVERGKRAGNVLTSSVYCNHLFLIPMFSQKQSHSLF